MARPKARPKKFAITAAITVTASVFGFHTAYGNPTNPAQTEPGQAVAAPPDNGCAGSCAPVPAPSGWIRPVDAPLWGGFRTQARPDHMGVDIGAARGDIIRAAAAGVVVRVRCNVTPEWHGCDQDGSPNIGGCGWYVDIRHANNVFTRYCHMLRRPDVAVDQHVAAGDPIGVVGSSGNSSAPHLHFEVHLGNEDYNAVDPVAFMAEQGAPLD